MAYTSKHLELIYNVSHETVRRWVEEFISFLSPTANPGKGKHRVFTEDDMSVLSFIAESKDKGMTFEEIRASLESGARGVPPLLPPGELQAMVVGEQEKRLALEVDYLRRSLNEALAEARKAEVLKEENFHLKSQLNTNVQRVDDLKQQLQQTQGQLDTAREEIKALLREIGDSYVKGVMETLNRKGDLPSK